MNDSLAAGTQIPWIQRAVEEGYAVIVLNPNLNEVTGTPIRVNLYADDEYSLADCQMCIREEEYIREDKTGEEKRDGKRRG